MRVTPNTALVAERVCVSFDQKQVVSDVSLTLDEGSVYALLGHNGAGKTTLLRSLVGFIRPTSGQVSYVDEPVAVFEDPQFPGDLRVRNLIEHQERRTGIRLDVALADAMGVSGFLGKRGDQLSAGMRQRLSLALATMTRSPVLLIDEPTVGLDRQGTAQLLEIVHELSDRGYCVVLSSHDLAELETVCDRVVCMRMGQVTFSGTIEDLGREVAAPNHIVRTSDDSAAAKALQRAGVRVARVAGGLKLEGQQDFAAAFRSIERVSSVLEVRLEQGLFARAYERFSALPTTLRSGVE